MGSNVSYQPSRVQMLLLFTYQSIQWTFIKPYPQAKPFTDKLAVNSPPAALHVAVGLTLSLMPDAEPGLMCTQLSSASIDIKLDHKAWVKR